MFIARKYGMYAQRDIVLTNLSVRPTVRTFWHVCQMPIQCAQSITYSMHMSSNSFHMTLVL